MRKRKRFYGGVGLHAAAGVFDANRKRVHDRPDYTIADARVVADWLNGADRPLERMTPPAADPCSPYRRQAQREGRLYRIGLEPLK